jgi:uncharacterized protein (UPF0333 family)
MKAQLSLEFLIVLLASMIILSIMIPLVQKAREVSEYAILSRNAQLILDKLYYSCERARISGESQLVTVNALSNFSINNISSTAIVSFAGRNLTKSGFGCALSLNLSRGESSLVLTPDP